MNYRILADSLIEESIDLSRSYTAKQLRDMRLVPAHVRLPEPIYRGNRGGAYYVESIGYGTYEYHALPYQIP
jgi:hypothetical protein